MISKVAAVGNYIAREYPGGRFSMEPVPYSDRVRLKLVYGPLVVSCEVSRKDFEWSGTLAVADQVLSEFRDNLPIFRAVNAATGETVWRGTKPERYLVDPGKPIFMERMAADGTWKATGAAPVSPRSVSKQAAFGTSYADPQTSHADASKAFGEIGKWLNQTGAHVHSTATSRAGLAAAHAAAQVAAEERKKREQEAELVRERQRQEAERLELEARARREMERLERERTERIRRSATGSFEPVDVMLAELRSILGHTAEKEAALRDKNDEDTLFGTGSETVQREILWADARQKLLELQAFVNARVEELDARIAGHLTPVDILDAETERVLSRQQERNILEDTSLEDVPIAAPKVEEDEELSDLDQFLNA